MRKGGGLCSLLPPSTLIFTQQEFINHLLCARTTLGTKTRNRKTIQSQPSRSSCVCALVLLSVCLSCRNKIPQTGWLKQQKFIFSRFWRLEVQGQGASRVGLRCGLSSWLADGRLLAVSSHGPSLVCVHGERGKEREHSGVFSYKDTSPIRLGPHPSDFI